jgi:hypothetical protein
MIFFALQQMWHNDAAGLCNWRQENWRFRSGCGPGEDKGGHPQAKSTKKTAGGYPPAASKSLGRIAILARLLCTATQAFAS